MSKGDNSSDTSLLFCIDTSSPNAIIFIMNTRALAQQKITIAQPPVYKAVDIKHVLGKQFSAICSFVDMVIDDVMMPIERIFKFKVTENGFTPRQESLALREIERARKYGKSFDSADAMFKDILGEDYRKYV